MEKEKDIAIIGDDDAVLGFKLAGVQHALVADESKLAEQVNEFKEAKMLIVTETVAEMLDKQGLRKKVQGTLVQIPEKSGSKGIAKQKLAELFESAIGVKLKR